VAAATTRREMLLLTPASFLSASRGLTQLFSIFQALLNFCIRFQQKFLALINYSIFVAEVIFIHPCNLLCTFGKHQNKSQMQSIHDPIRFIRFI